MMTSQLIPYIRMYTKIKNVDGSPAFPEERLRAIFEANKPKRSPLTFEKLMEKLRGKNDKNRIEPSEERLQEAS